MAWRKIDKNFTNTTTVLFIAKHAKSNEGFHEEDGNHAVYHQEVRNVLKRLGFSVHSMDDIHEIEKFVSKKVFVFSLLNRAGFFNSEALVPLICEKHNLPYLGALPNIRILADDKHLSKIIFRSKGLLTPNWALISSRHDIKHEKFISKSGQYIVKPNSSSASWGIKLFLNWENAIAYAYELNKTCRQSIIEEFVEGINITVPCFNSNTLSFLPAVEELSSNSDNIISHEEKRGFNAGVSREIFNNQNKEAELRSIARRALVDFYPFDYGRIDFRLTQTGEAYLIEHNISCNLQSTKSICYSAQSVNLEQDTLIYNLVYKSLQRQTSAFEH